MNINSLTR